MREQRHGNNRALEFTGDRLVGVLRGSGSGRGLKTPQLRGRAQLPGGLGLSDRASLAVEGSWWCFPWVWVAGVQAEASFWGTGGRITLTPSSSSQQPPLQRRPQGCL